MAGGAPGTRRFAARAAGRVGDFGGGLDAEGRHTDGYAPIALAQRGAVDGPASSSHGAAGARIEHRRGESRTTHLMREPRRMIRGAA